MDKLRKALTYVWTATASFRTMWFIIILVACTLTCMAIGVFGTILGLVALFGKPLIGVGVLFFSTGVGTFGVLMAKKLHNRFGLF